LGFFFPEAFWSQFNHADRREWYFVTLPITIRVELTHLIVITDS